MFEKKSKLLEGRFNVYGVYDKVSKHYLRLYFNSSDEDFVRLYLPEVIVDTPLRDLEVYRIATFSDVTGVISPATKRKVNLNCYKFPHSRLSSVGDDVSLEEIEKGINDVKNNIKAQLTTLEPKESK